MVRALLLSSACALCLVLAACGGGDSANTLATGQNAGGTANSTPPGVVPTPAVVLQDGTGTGMTDRELAFASEVFELLNAYRTANGQGALAWDAPITAVAQSHTEYMQGIGQLTHAGPPPCTVPSLCLASRLTTGGVAYLAAGENVAHAQLTAQEVMNSWIASPSHNANMLDAAWTHVGIGFREGVSPVNATMTGPWWTQVFVQR